MIYPDAYLNSFHPYTSINLPPKRTRQYASQLQEPLMGVLLQICIYNLSYILDFPFLYQPCRLRTPFMQLIQTFYYFSILEMGDRTPLFERKNKQVDLRSRSLNQSFFVLLFL
jgi:hypothetical protein